MTLVNYRGMKSGFISEIQLLLNIQVLDVSCILVIANISDF